MDDVDPGYRRDSRPEFRGGEPRRSAREAEPLEQRFDRWVSAGRQLVDGVAGSRPGSRPPARGGEGRAPGRGGFDGLGRWVEERLDWFLEDGDDWREPWQEAGGRGPFQSPDAPASGQPWSTRGMANPGERADSPDPSFPARRSRAAEPLRSSSPSSPDNPRTPSNRTGPLTSPPPPAAAAPRRRLEALSRRGLAPQSAAATPEDEAWPDDDSFNLPRWQRPAAARRPSDPLPPAPDPAEAAGRPLPRSTRRSGPRS
ncbi:MAG: hypothetical protein WAM11_13005 [Cyanobium sp.]